MSRRRSETRRALVGAFALTLLGPLAACGSAPDESAPAERDPSTTTPEPGTPAAVEGADPSAAPAAPRASLTATEDGSTDETLGRVVTRGGVVDVGLAFEGRVRRLLVGVGATVDAGEVLAEVEVPELAIAAAEAQGLATERRVLDERRARVARLVEEGLAQREQLEGVDVTLAGLGTRRDVALAMLRSADITAADQAHLARHGVLRVRAPRAGALVEVLVPEGGSVGPDAPLARLVGPSEAVAQVTTARRPPAGAATISAEGRELTVAPLGEPVLDPGTGLYHTFYPLPEALPHGARVTVRFPEARP